LIVHGIDLAYRDTSIYQSP